MTTIVIKGIVSEDLIKKFMVDHNLQEGDCRIISYEEYEAERSSRSTDESIVEIPTSLKEVAELYLKPNYGMEDITGWMKEQERKERKFRKEQDKWRRKFSNR